VKKERKERKEKKISECHIFISFFSFISISLSSSSSFSFIPSLHEMEDDLLSSVDLNRVGHVRRLLKSPTLNVNHRGSHGWTALHRASMRGHLSIIQLLLLHPAIDVNQGDDYGGTPFLLACSEGETEVVRLLLEDHRIDVEAPSLDGTTPLWCASLWGYLEIVQWIVVSGRKVDLEQAVHYGKEYTVVEIARKNGKVKVAELLEKFREKPRQTRLEVIADLGLQGLLATELFASVVFLCDDFLRLSGPVSEVEGNPNQEAAAINIQTNNNNDDHNNSEMNDAKRDAKEVNEAKEKEIAHRRFFVMAGQLPMELQMVLCNRVYGLTKDTILAKNSETAFRALAVYYYHT